MNEQTPAITEPNYKRNVAYKLRIGQILKASPIIENERLKHVELDGKQIVRVNLIANIIDKYVQDGEKKFASLTLDDATGQIKVKTFGDDISKFEKFNQGDTILVIGLLRSWNNEIYLTPEILKTKEPQYLLVRKLESDLASPKNPPKEELRALKDKIIQKVKDSEKDNGVEIESLILDLKESPSIINSEIKKLLEEGLVYEPRPGRLRWLG